MCWVVFPRRSCFASILRSWTPDRTELSMLQKQISNIATRALHLANVPRRDRMFNWKEQIAVFFFFRYPFPVLSFFPVSVFCCGPIWIALHANDSEHFVLSHLPIRTLPPCLSISPFAVCNLCRTSGFSSSLLPHCLSAGCSRKLIRCLSLWSLSF